MKNKNFEKFFFPLFFDRANAQHSMANWNSNERLVMNNLTFKYFSPPRLCFVYTPVVRSNSFFVSFAGACVLQFEYAGKEDVSWCAESISTFLFLATYPRKLKRQSRREKNEKWMFKKRRRKILTFLISEIFVNCLPNSHKSTPNFSAQFRTLQRKKKKNMVRKKCYKIET